MAGELTPEEQLEAKKQLDLESSTKQTVKTVPYDVFKEKNDARILAVDRAEKAETELEQMKESQKKAEEDELAKKCEFKQIAEQRESELGVLKGELETFRADNKARWEAIKKEIPDDKISFFADGDSNESISANLRKFDEYVALGVFEKPNTPSVDGRPPIKSDTSKDGDFGGFKTRIEFAESDPAGYNKWLKEKQTGLSGIMGFTKVITKTEDISI